MKEKINNPYLRAKEFHQIFDPIEEPQSLVPLSREVATIRAGFKLEELVEFIYAAADNNEKGFEESLQLLHAAIDQAREKIMQKRKPVENPLVEEVDALVDLLYFTYGTFVHLGIDPAEVFECVHQANMGKLFPDGQPRYDEKTGKVLKPRNWEKDFAPEAKIQAIIEKYQQRLDER